MAADLSFGGTDDENVELRKLYTEVVRFASAQTKFFRALSLLTSSITVGES